MKWDNEHKTAIFGIIVTVLFVIGWFSGYIDGLTDMFAYLFIIGFLYFLYAFVTINEMEQDIEGQKYLITKLTREVEWLEKYIKDRECQQWQTTRKEKNE